jgi:hypothetical protein
MTTKGFVDFENLKQYDEQLKKYIDKKIEEAIRAKEQKLDTTEKK